MYRFYGWEQADVTDGEGRTPRDLYDLLLGIWCVDSCTPRMRDRWSADNPTVGQCSITAFLVQDLFGGEVWGVPLDDGNYHCFNKVDGHTFDLASEQFLPQVCDYEHVVRQSREVHFAKEEKRLRYEWLCEQVAKSW